jgi:DNA polymerase III gamma/tau subunit
MKQNYVDFHAKYRPAKLSELIGHEAAVTKLKGMLESGKVPSALLFLGPSSVGKTTLARVLAAEVSGTSVDTIPDYKEINAADARTIEDVRELIRISKFKSLSKKRFIVIDEAQQIVSNPTACSALLKPIEEASKGTSDTIWILCSMDPSKFTTGNGKAIANRCQQFVLEPHTNTDLYKQGKRIRSAEGMDYVSDDLLKEVVRRSNSEMRTLANLMQGIQAFKQGNPKAKIEIETVLQASAPEDDALVIKVVVSALTGKYAEVHRATMNVADPFQFLNKMVSATEFCLGNAVMDGARHSKLWWTPVNKEIVKQLGSHKITLGLYAALAECMVKTKQEAANFSVGEMPLLSSKIFRFIKDNFK